MGSTDSIRGRIKSDLGDKGWWYSAIGGVLSTVIGIALTFGVSAWISHRNDKQQAREMMFNIIMVAKSNGESVAQYDTLFISHYTAANQIISIYRRTNGFENVDSLTNDSLLRAFVSINTYKEIPINHVGVDKYFYSPETMHQFGNTALYSTFSSFVEFDKQTYEDIRSLRKMWYDLNRKMKFQATVSIKHVELEELLAEMIEDRTIPDYAENIDNVFFTVKLRYYKWYYENLLLCMGATEEDLKDYAKSLRIKGVKAHKLKYDAYH